MKIIITQGIFLAEIGSIANYNFPVRISVRSVLIIFSNVVHLQQSCVRGVGNINLFNVFSMNLLSSNKNTRLYQIKVLINAVGVALYKK
jgi:hypothetical protein